MTVVRFATTCDHVEDGHVCGARSYEYTMWPTCSDCGDHVCPTHMAPGTLDEGDGDRRDYCLCVDCAAAADAECLECARSYGPHYRGPCDHWH